MPPRDLDDPTLDELCAGLRDYAARAIGGAWVQAAVYAEIEADDHGLTYGRFVREPHDTVVEDFATDYRAYILFNALRMRCAALFGQPWSRARVAAFPDGAYTLTLAYAPAADEGER